MENNANLGYKQQYIIDYAKAHNGIVPLSIIVELYGYPSKKKNLSPGLPNEVNGLIALGIFKRVPYEGLKLIIKN